MSRNDPKTTTAESIAASLLCGDFARFIENSPHWREYAVPQVMAVAVLPEVAACWLELRADVRVVLLSAETAAAKLAKHKNTAADWRELQGLLDNADMKFHQPPHSLLFVRQVRWLGKPKYRAAVVKRTQDGRELFVTTMYWLRKRDIRAAEEKWGESKK